MNWISPISTLAKPVLLGVARAPGIAFVAITALRGLQQAEDAGEQLAHRNIPTAQALGELRAPVGSVQRMQDDLGQVVTKIRGGAPKAPTPRAGEQGRGFAVVAGEVRHLPQRSANAATELKNAI